MNLILSETNRSYQYLRTFLNQKHLIKNIIYYSLKRQKVFLKLNKVNDLKKKTFFIRSNNINSKKIENILSKIDGPFLYSGYPSGIIKNSNLLKKCLYHCHPGDLPKFKGSTTIFYSLALKENVTVTCFRMSKGIDTGKIVYKKEFRSPRNKKNLINNKYDDYIRAKTFISFLKKKKKFNYNKNLKKKFFSYYCIAHPVI